MKEFYTVVVFPGATGSPKRSQIPKRWFRVCVYSALILVVGVVSSSAYLSQRYFQLVSEEAELTELRRESKISKIQVEKFTQRDRTLQCQ